MKQEEPKASAEVFWRRLRLQANMRLEGVIRGLLYFGSGQSHLKESKIEEVFGSMGGYT